MAASGPAARVPGYHRADDRGAPPMHASETLLNTHQESDTVVIHETAAKFHLRLGRQVLAIENRGYKPKGTFNRTGTDSNSAVRLTR